MPLLPLLVSALLHLCIGASLVPGPAAVPVGPLVLMAGLQLSGHTHGGQFWPWNLLVRFQQSFTQGLQRLQNLWVYTSRGSGYRGPPKRFGAPSEITRLRLVAA